MRFAFWYYVCKFSILLLPLAFLGKMYPEHVWLSIIGVTSLAMLIALGVTGAVLAVIMILRQLKMKCPFCSRYGAVGGNKRGGLLLECEECGHVHGAGFLGLRLVREESDEDS